MKNAGFTGPLIIILLGVFFLVNNFGFHVPFGHLVREFWPVILIVIGGMKVAEAMAIGPRAHGTLTGGVMMLVSERCSCCRQRSASGSAERGR